MSFPYTYNKVIEVIENSEWNDKWICKMHIYDETVEQTINTIKIRIQAIWIENSDWLFAPYEAINGILYDFLKKDDILKLIYFKAKQNKEKELKLNKSDLNRLLSYLKYEKEVKEEYKRPNYKFDCHSFTHYIKWITQEDDLNLDNWNFEEVKRLKDISKIIKWGNILHTIWINKFKNWEFQNIEHVAFYLWEWLYLSKFWDMNLMVTNLTQMKKNYPFDHAFIHKG